MHEEKKVIHLADRLKNRKELCPICKKPSTPLYRPFCSTRCAEIDLGRWLKGNYAIPTDDRASFENPGEED